MTTPSYGNSHSHPGSQAQPEYQPPAGNVDPAAQQAPPWHALGPMPSPPRDACQVCGGFPAVHVDVRAHRGLVIRMQWETISGWRCSICGIALIRKMTTQTLWQGWWGLGSFFVGAPFALLQNLRTYRRLRQLPFSVCDTKSLQVSKDSHVKEVSIG